MNTFKGARLEFANLGIHFLTSEIIKFRKQLTVRQEFKSESGWDNAMNEYMIRELNKLRDTIENIAYNPSKKPLEELKAEAADTTRTVQEDYDETSISSDNLLMPVAATRPIIWDLTGTDVNLPQIDEVSHPNDAARAFITTLDHLFKESTRIDSVEQSLTITKYEATMLITYLNVMFTICQRKGGEKNRSDIPTGTLPADEPTTFQG